jgi:hypothetical protein
MTGMKSQDDAVDERSALRRGKRLSDAGQTLPALEGSGASVRCV